MRKEIKATIKFDGDSKSYHRFKIIHAKGEIVGTVYLLKEMNPLPERLVLEREK